MSCNGINCQHSDSLLASAIDTGRKLFNKNDPESVLNAARGGSVAEKVLRKMASGSENITGTLWQNVQQQMSKYLIYEASEDELLHGHVSDAKLAFYTQNFLVLLAVLITLFVVVKLCVSHRCWQRRYQKYKKPVPLDYSAQVRQLRKKDDR